MKRDITLDSLRGLLLVVMLIDHLAISLSNYTIHMLGYITAAEGFIFLSGFVAGLVYTGIHDRDGSAALWQAVLRRIRVIYLFHILIFALLLIIGMHSQLLVSAWKETIPYFSDPLMINEPLKALGLGAIFLYQPAYLDILPLYFFFLLATPVALVQFARGRARAVWIGAFSIWLIAQFGALSVFKRSLATYLPVDLGYFDILSWQLLFMAGLYFGFRKRRTKAPASITLDGRLIIVCLIVAVTLCLHRHGYFSALVTVPEALLSKDRLGLIRLVNFAAIAYLVAGLRHQFRRVMTWPWFSSLGQHSLQVYAFHVVLIFLLAPILPMVRSLPQPLSLVITTASVLSLTIPAWIHQRYREVVSQD